MAKHKLKNGLGKTLTLSNSDSLSVDKEVIYLNTVDELSATVGVNVGDVCHVSEDGRGGIFTWTGDALLNDGGVHFNGWKRDYSGAVNVKWFGALDDLATSVEMAASVSKYIYVENKNRPLLLSRQIKISESINIDFCGNTIEYTGIGEKYSALIEFKGVHEQSVSSTATANFIANQNRIEVNTHSFAVGDYVTGSYGEIGSEEYSNFEKVIFTANIISIDGNILTLDYTPSFDLLLDGSGYYLPIVGSLTLTKCKPLFSPSIKNVAFSNCSERVALVSFDVVYGGEGINLMADGITSHLAYFNGCRDTYIRKSYNIRPLNTTAGHGYTVQAFGSCHIGMIDTIGEKVRHHWDSSFYSINALCRDCKSYDAQGNYDYGCHSQYVSGLLLDNCEAHGDSDSSARETGVLWGNDDSTFGGVADRLRIFGGSYTGKALKIHSYPINYTSCYVKISSIDLDATGSVISFNIRVHCNKNIIFTDSTIKGFKIGFGSVVENESISFNSCSISLDSQGFAGTTLANLSFFNSDVFGVPTSGVDKFEVVGGVLDVGTQSNVVVNNLILSNCRLVGNIIWVGTDINSLLFVNNVEYFQYNGVIELRNHADISNIRSTATGLVYPSITLNELYLDSKRISIVGGDRVRVNGQIGVGGYFLLSSSKFLGDISGYDLSVTDRKILFSSLIVRRALGVNTASTSCRFSDVLTYE